MTVRRTMTMNWDDLAAPDADDNDDHFFDSSDRASVSFAFPIDNGNLSSSDDDEFEDGRMSFASTVSSAGSDDFRSSFRGGGAGAPMIGDYDLWTAEPGSIKERRQRLLQGMGLSGDKEHSNAAINGLPRAVSNKMKNSSKVSPMETDSSPPNKESKQEPEPSPPPSPMTSPILLVRSRSENDIGSFCMEKERRKQIIGEIPKQRLTRTFTTSSPCARLCCLNGNSIQISRKEDGGDSSMRGGGLGLNSRLSSSGFGAFFLIKNLDTGNEFIVNEYDQHGMWNRLSDLQTGKQLTMEEFEKSVGYSPVVKELMRRENISRNPGDGGGERKATAANSYLSKSVRYSKRRGVALLKNIKGVANTMSGLIITDKEREHNNSSMEQKTSKNNGSPSSKWTKVRQHGKSLKELTALHLCQEIQAHEGSIWTIRFSLDAKYLASAGEDRLIHVWEVQECELMSMGSTEDYCCTLSGQCTPQQPNACSSSDRPNLAEVAALMEKEKKKKGKNSSGSKKGNSIPDYVYSPETVFSLSEKPACTFKGHLDDVLDLSWSKSQLLLSSSMDKTVRLWDMETQTCLKLFAHNDYVTCIQFNPVDDNYFISGSLDAKVRIWSIDGRQVIDWSDLHEMVTAACFTPDGQGALIGSHRGNCRLYSITDGKLSPLTQFDIQNKKKSQAKKITGLQFAPGNNSSEVLITSADSRIRIYDGSDMIGFRNTSSQISASFSPDGKYIVCASEDSHVYIWKRPEDPKNGSSVTGKNKGFINTRSHELFQCREVSVAVPWPGTIKGDPPPPPPPPVHSKRHSKRSSGGPPPPQQTDSRTTADDGIANGKRGNLPPLPKKNAAAPEEEISGRVDSGIGAGGESSNSSPASGRFGDSISESGNLSSWSGSWSVYDGGNSHRSPGTAAWGMVIVTAGLGGEIRAYQNFGLPVRIGRQNNLFNAT